MYNMKTIRHCLWFYDVFPEKCFHINLGEYDTYGIKVTGYEFAMVLHDVSISRNIADDFVEIFNQYQLSPVHLDDVVMDMLP